MDHEEDPPTEIINESIRRSGSLAEKFPRSINLRCYGRRGGVEEGGEGFMSRRLELLSPNFLPEVLGY